MGELKRYAYLEVRKDPEIILGAEALSPTSTVIGPIYVAKCLTFWVIPHLTPDFVKYEGNIKVYSESTTPFSTAEFPTPVVLPPGKQVFLGKILEQEQSPIFSTTPGRQVFPEKFIPPEMMVKYSVPDETCSCRAGRFPPPETPPPDKWERMLKEEKKRLARVNAALGVTATVLPVVDTFTPRLPKPIYIPGWSPGQTERAKTSFNAAATFVDNAQYWAKQAQDPPVEWTINPDKLIEEVFALKKVLDNQKDKAEKVGILVNNYLGLSTDSLEQFYVELATAFTNFIDKLEQSRSFELAFFGLAPRYREILSRYGDALNSALVKIGDFPIPHYYKSQQGYNAFLQELETLKGNIDSAYIALDFQKGAVGPGDVAPDSKISILLNYHEPGTVVYFEEFDSLPPDKRDKHLIERISRQPLTRSLSKVKDLSLLRPEGNIAWVIGTNVDAESWIKEVQALLVVKDLQIPVVATSQAEADKMAEELLSKSLSAEGAEVTTPNPDVAIYPEDLRVYAVGAKPYLEITLHNLGVKPAVNIPVQIWEVKSEGELVPLDKQIITSPILPAESQKINIPLSIMKEVGEILVQVNPLREIKELDYTNNEAKASLVIAGLIEGIHIDPSELKLMPGQEFSVGLVSTIKDMRIKMEAHLNINPSYLEVESFAPHIPYLNPMLGQDRYFDNMNGYIDFSWKIPENIPVEEVAIQPGTIRLATITFKAKDLPVSVLPIKISLDFNLASPRKTVFLSSEGKELEISLRESQIQIFSPGIVEGKVELQGRQDYAEAMVYINDEYKATTNADGSFQISPIVEGVHIIEIKRPGFLSAARGDLEVKAGKISTLPEVIMLAGDINSDDVVDDKDLSFIRRNYGTTEPLADINGNGVVESTDIWLAKRNNGKRARSPWYGGVMITDK